MNDWDRKYNKMKKRCEKYHNNIDNFRNAIYGYNTRLDCILPYSSDDFFIQKDDIWGVENFCNQIAFYYSSLSKEAATQFTEAFTAEDKIYVSDLIKCVLYFLKTECNYDEYTFLSFIKILKTFLVEYVDDYIPTIDDSTFWHMYKINNVDTSEICPLEIIRSFENLYKDYNFEYTKRLVDGLYSCIRFFLFENELDYVHNEIIFSATLKLINEIDERLALIFENITPRKDNFDLYE